MSIDQAQQSWVGEGDLIWPDADDWTVFEMCGLDVANVSSIYRL